MADYGMRLLERRWKESGSFDDLFRFMRDLDRTGTPYVVEAPANGRQGCWYRTPIACFEFGTSSSRPRNSPNGWTYAQNQGGFLQSLAEAVFRRVALYKDNQSRGRSLDYSKKYQVTRTVNLKFYDDEKMLSAFAELPDEKASLELLTQGLAENNAGRELFRQCNDPLIARLLAQARNTGRIRPVRGSSDLKLATGEGSSEYGRNEDIIAVFGNPVAAELNSGYLHQRGYENGYLLDLTKDFVEKQLSKRKDHVLVRSVGLGGVGLVAVNRFGGDGRACPVAHNGAKNFSNGNRG